MANVQEPGTYKTPSPDVHGPTKPVVKPVVKQPVKPTTPETKKPKRTLMNVKPSGLTPRTATRIVDEQYSGNVQGAWHDYAPGAIKEYMAQGLPFAQARAQAMDDFGFTNDPESQKGPRLYSSYWFQPDYSEEPQTYGPRQPDYGGGGGGGGYPTPPIPEMKIRTTSGIRRSPYWESDDPYNSGTFEPRFVVLGNNSAW